MDVEKNETQIATSNGKLQIADQISNVLDSSSIDRYVDVCNQLIADTDRRNSLIDKYTSRTGQGITREESLELDMLKNRINTLTKEKDEFEKTQNLQEHTNLTLCWELQYLMRKNI